MRFSPFGVALGASLALHCGPSFRTQLQGQMTIPASPPGAIDTFPGIPGLTEIDFNQNQDFRNEGIAKNSVKSVVADSIRLQIINNPRVLGADGTAVLDFTFLDNLQLVATTGSAEAVIAQKSSIGQLNLTGANPTLAMEPTRIELKTYVTASSMSVAVRGAGRAPPSDVQINVTIGMEVEIQR